MSRHLTLADNAHPLMRFVLMRLKAEGISASELERRAGLAEGRLWIWGTGTTAITLQNMEAVLNALGYELKPKLMATAPKASFLIETGATYRLRCGQLADVTAFDGRSYQGRLRKVDVALQWNMAGQRIPAGGQDPMDIVALEPRLRAFTAAA